MHHLRRALGSDAELAVVYVDLDDFKLVNDTLGHGAGDDLLRHVATAMNLLIGPGDLLARNGGDEFVLVSDACEEVHGLAERLGAAITAPVRLHGVEISVGASIGVAVAPADGTEPDTLLEVADAAMYEAKRSGRNQIGRRARLRDRGRRREELELTVSLPEAVARDELVLHWQPLVDVETLSLMGAEALVRWRHPLRGLLAPGEFVPFAEQTGMIAAVDQWVASAVSRQRLQWQTQGLDPYVGFNLAPQIARRPGALADLLERLTVDGLSLDHVTIELTESEALHEDHQLVAFVEGLHSAGLTVSLDDFGVAYSSLSRLREVPARWIKLDRSFLQRVPQDPTATVVLHAMLDLLHALQLEIIVEGVERPEQLAALREHGGVTAAQGFMLGGPMPAGELEPRLRQSPVSRLQEAPPTSVIAAAPALGQRAA